LKLRRWDSTVLIGRHRRKPLQRGCDKLVERRGIYVDKVDPRQAALVRVRVLPRRQIRDQALKACALAYTRLTEKDHCSAGCDRGDRFKTARRTDPLTGEPMRLAQESIRGRRQRAVLGDTPALNNPTEQRTHARSTRRRGT